VMRTFRLSPGQRNFLLGARRGEGLFATKIWTPMEVVASPKEMEMANTTLSAFSQKQDQHDVLEELASNELLLPPTQPSHSTKIVSNRTTQPNGSPQTVPYQNGATQGRPHPNDTTQGGPPNNPFEQARRN